MPLPIKIKRIDADLPLPTYATPGSCGFDLYSREEHTLQPGEIALLPSNFVIATPPGYVLIVSPRSSLARKKGLTMPNSMGIIDQDYSGDNDEVLIQVENITKEPVTVERGERIAQGTFLKMETADWQIVESMDQPDRGGIGSTGGYR